MSTDPPLTVAQLVAATEQQPEGQRDARQRHAAGRRGDAAAREVTSPEVDRDELQAGHESLEENIVSWLDTYDPLPIGHGLRSLPPGYPVLVPGRLVRKRPASAGKPPRFFVDVPAVLQDVVGASQIRVIGSSPHLRLLEESGFAEVLTFVPSTSGSSGLRSPPSFAAWSRPLAPERYQVALRNLEHRRATDDLATLRARVQLVATEQERSALELQRTRQRLQEWGLFMNPDELSSAAQLGVSPASFHQRLRQAGLQYSASTVAELLAALDTHQLVILSGPPGHGKTRIVRELGKLPGVEEVVVRVRPSWHDPADLLGYQSPLSDPMSARPHVTDFAQALIQAELDQDRLFLVLLDELNLAPVEHYLADFLSLLENRSRWEDRTKRSSWVSLGYSWPTSEPRSTAGQGPAVPDAPGAGDDVAAVVIAHLLAQLEELQGLSGNRVTLPPNVRLIGTVNVDATVEQLSPRVVDRSVVVQVGGRELPEGAPAPELSAEPLQLRGLSELPAWADDLPTLGPLRDDVRARLDRVREGIQGLGWGVQLSPRRERQAALLADALAKVLGPETPDKGALIADALVRSLVLPRVMDVDRHQAQEALAALETALEEAGCAVALSELRAMCKRPHATVSYWVY